MAVSRGGDAVIAAGPTELKRYLPVSVIATAIVAGVPLWAVFNYGERLGFLATVLSVLLSFGLAHLGALAWKRWPASRDVVFNDLMLWGFVRRVVTQRRLIRRVERLGFSVANDPDEMTIEERTDLLKKLAEGLETGDPYTHGHSQRVARHAYMVAKTMKLTRRQTEKIRLAGVIHDVGKLRIPREIITKPGKLTDAEFDVIKRHTVDGAAMVEVLRDPEVTDMVRHHHERLDGSGYPDKLSGDEISMGSRVLAVADTFDAASSLRPYRAAQKHKVALDILKKEAEAGKLDPAVVDAFIRYYSGRRSLRWWAFLSAGPTYLHELPFALVQRAGAAGLANAAVVGITAVALAPGSPLHGRPVDHDAMRKDRAIARQNEDRANPGDPSGAASTTTTNGTRAVSNGNDRSKPNSSQREKARAKKAKNGNDGKAASPPSAKVGPKEKEPKASNGKGPSKEDASSGGVVAGAVDTATGGAPAVVGGVKNGNNDKEIEGPATEPATEPVAEEADPVSQPPAPGAPDKDKVKK